MIKKKTVQNKHHNKYYIIIDTVSILTNSWLFLVGERPHICSDCGSAFAQERGLQEHRNIHTGERPFQCPVCRKGFSHSRTLAKHMVVHSEARPYMCSDCGRAFKIKDNLHQHQKKMHPSKYS